MKQTICMLALTLLGLASLAQDHNLYLKGGLNIANVSISNNGRYDDANALMSFHAGIMADLPVSDYLAFQPGLLFTGKGSKTQSGETTDASYFKATSNPYYIELPVNLVAKIPMQSKESSFFIGAGPYLAVGVGGKNKAEGKVFGASFNRERNIKFSNDDPGTLNEEEGAGFGVMKRFDYGLNGTAGFELNRLLLSVNYGYGLAKLASGADNDDDKNKHRVLSFSVGFKL